MTLLYAPVRSRYLRVLASVFLTGTPLMLILVAAAGVCIGVSAILFWHLVGPMRVVAPFAPDFNLSKQVAQVNAQHPFGVTPVDQAGAGLLDGGSGWRLLATLASVTGKGMALLDREGGEARVLQSGDLLVDGRRVTKISADAIEVQSAAGTQRIELASAVAPIAPPPQAGGGAVGARPISPRRQEGGEPLPSEIMNVTPRFTN